MRCRGFMPGSVITGRGFFMELLRLIFSVVFRFFSQEFLSFFTPVIFMVLVCWVCYWTARLLFMRR